MKKIFLYIIFFCSTVAVAQQIPLYSQYWMNPMLINPGFTGRTDNIETNIIHRNQWKSIPGAPVTSVLSVDGATNDEKVGLGLIISDDKAGLFAKRAIYTSYSYNIKLAEGHYLRPGLNFGMQSVAVDFSRSNIQDKSDPKLLSVGNGNKNSFDANFGVAYNWKDLNAGVSVLQIIPHKYRFNNDTGAYYKSASKVNVFATYLIPISKEHEINVRPVLSLNVTPKAPFQFDFVANFDYKDLVYAGFGYRFNNAACFNIGVKWNKALRVSYNYDMAMGKLSGYTGGSHEIALGYSFGRGSGSSDGPRDLMGDNTGGSANTDSLKNELANVKKELAVIKAEMDVQKSGDIAGLVKDDFILMYASEFKDKDDATPAVGFYLILSQFKGLKQAEDDVKALETDGFTPQIMSHPTKGYYVYSKMTPSKKNAEEMLKGVRWKRMDSYILELK